MFIIFIFVIKCNVYANEFVSTAYESTLVVGTSTPLEGNGL